MGEYKYLTTVLSSSLRARLLTFISRIAPALCSPWDFFCALRPKRTNESIRILAHINPCLVRALVILPSLCKEIPHSDISTQSSESIHYIGISVLQGNGHILGILITMPADSAFRGKLHAHVRGNWRQSAVQGGHSLRSHERILMLCRMMATALV